MDDIGRIEPSRAPLAFCASYVTVAIADPQATEVIVVAISVSDDLVADVGDAGPRAKQAVAPPPTWTRTEQCG